MDGETREQNGKQEEASGLVMLTTKEQREMRVILRSER